MRAIEEKIEKLEEKVEAPVERKSDPSPVTSNQGLKLGEKVTVSTLNAEGVVTALGESDAEVQIGTIRVRAKMSDLIRKVQEKQEMSSEKRVAGKASSSTHSSLPVASSPGMEVDLRGLMSEDALDKMERYLEQAYLSGLPWVRIIHGKGTGKLRQAVREALKGHTYVKSFEEGAHTEGGEGVTVAKLNAS